MHAFSIAFLRHLFCSCHSSHLPVFCGFVFAMPELVLRLHYGHFVKVVFGHGRRHHPFQTAGIPRVGAGSGARRRAECSATAGEDVDEYQQDADGNDERPYGCHEVPEGEAVFGSVGGYSP